MKWGAFLLVWSCLVLAGCGGGQDSSQGPIGDGGDHTSTVGIASIAYKGAFVPAAVFSQAGVTVTSMAGAAFTNAVLTPAPKNENSVIVFALDGEIWTEQNGVPTQITHNLQNFQTPNVSKNGLVVFSGFDYGTSQTQLFGCNLDGSNLHRITSSGLFHNSPSLSPSGTRIVFSDGTSNLYTVNIDGSSETKVPVTAANLTANTLVTPSWSPDGSKFAFVGIDSSLGKEEIYTVPIAGGTATEMTNTSLNCSNPRWSPNQFLIAFTLGTALSDIVAVDIRRPFTFDGLAVPASGSNTNFYYGSFSPDGNSVLYLADDSANDKILESPVSSSLDVKQLYSIPNGETLLAPFWSPYFGPKTFIGSGGEMTTAAGFIWGQLGDGFGGFATIAATTPTTLTVALQPAGTAGGPLVYLAKADKITKIVYSNSYFGAYNAVTPTNSKQALISVSTVTGQIDTVAPLAEPGSTRSTRGGLAYDGKFVAIYDAHGKNVAPEGATHIELDTKSGALESWR
ncbi:MAG TPA: hypothetical protein VG944_10380 [Fimbriimonas sp.]|nr:hypothetical protein [Fimbriimonas sp.]